MPSRWLNMGCGRDIRQAFVNADSKPLKGVQVVCDFSRFPWPFVDNAFEKVLAIHVIEHLPNTVRAMEELHRITAPGARTTVGQSDMRGLATPGRWLRRRPAPV